MNKEKLIGRKVKGFKFKTTNLLCYETDMDKHLGEVGIIITYEDKGSCFLVKFGKYYWSYPADQIEKHLVEEEFKENPLVDEDFNKHISTISSFKNPILFDGAKDLICVKEYNKLCEESNKLFKHICKSINKKTKEMTEEKRNKKVEKLQAKIDKLKAMEFKPKLANSWDDLNDITFLNLDLLGRIVIRSEDKKLNKKLIATVKLYDLMKEANGDWVADWSDKKQKKYTITRGDNKFKKYILLTTEEFISLKDEETREHFLKHHKELINDYYMH